MRVTVAAHLDVVVDARRDEGGGRRVLGDAVDDVPIAHLHVDDGARATVVHDQVTAVRARHDVLRAVEARLFQLARQTCMK